jgi:S1-C subfamily serine protease
MKPCAIIVLLLALPQVVSAKPYRFHPLYQSSKSGPRSFADRLKPGTRAALRGVVNISYASGFIVHDDGAGKGLMLTNEHVVRNGLASGYPLYFFDREVGKVSRVLTSNPELDYALVEVELPVGGGSRAMKLEPHGLRSGRPIYTLAGYADLGILDPAGKLTVEGLKGVVHGNPASLQRIVGGYRNQFAIALGQSGSARPDEILASGHEIYGVESNLPNSNGMSGSPVLAHDTDAVVSIHSSGWIGRTAPWQETSIPIHLILGDLQKKGHPLPH